MKDTLKFFDLEDMLFRIFVISFAKNVNLIDPFVPGRKRLMINKYLKVKY